MFRHVYPLCRQTSDVSESDDEEERATLVELRKRTAKSTIDVDTRTLALVGDQAVAASSTRFTPKLHQHKIFFNVPADELHAPIVGPAHPYAQDGLAAGLKNHASGHVEDLCLNPVIFEMQYNAFHAHNAAEAPTGDGTRVGAGADVPPAKKRKTEVWQPTQQM